MADQDADTDDVPEYSMFGSDQYLIEHWSTSSRLSRVAQTRQLLTEYIRLGSYNRIEYKNLAADDENDDAFAESPRRGVSGSCEVQGGLSVDAVCDLAAQRTGVVRSLLGGVCRTDYHTGRRWLGGCVSTSF